MRYVFFLFFDLLTTLAKLVSVAASILLVGEGLVITIFWFGQMALQIEQVIDSCIRNKNPDNPQIDNAKTDETGFWRFCHYTTGHIRQHNLHQFRTFQLHL